MRNGNSENALPERRVLNIAILLVPLIYTIIRAYRLSITHDEALTFLLHASRSFDEIIHFSRPIKLNNHLLNTLLIKLFSGIWTPTEIVIRTPALLGHALYLTGVYLLTRRYLKGIALTSSLIILTCHPFLLDLFSCARGYALGLGFMMFGLLFLLIALELPGRPQRQMILSCLSVVMMTAAVLSNLVFLHVMIIDALLIFSFSSLDVWRSKKANEKACGHDSGKLLIVVAVQLLAAVSLVRILYKPVRSMMDGNEFFYGGTRGFWQDTVRSLIEVSLYSQSDPPSLLKVILEVSVLVLLLFSGWIFIYNNRQKKSAGTVEPFEILMVFFVLSIGFSIMQHFVLGTRYLIDRTASHILVLFLLVMVFTFRAAFQRSRAGITIAYKAIIFVITILYVINFIRVANVSYYLLWRYDASCKHVIEYLSDIYKNKAPPDNSITLGANWINEPALNYYIIFRFDLRWMRGVDRSGPDGNYNYYILQEADRHLIDTLNLKVLERFPVSGTTLAACAGPPPEIH